MGGANFLESSCVHGVVSFIHRTTVFKRPETEIGFNANLARCANTFLATLNSAAPVEPQATALTLTGTLRATLTLRGRA